MKAAIAGSTGFIGSILLTLLEKDQDFTEVQVLSRRALELPDKFNVLVGNLSEQKLDTIDSAFCALGTTIATAGSQEAFYKVDHDLVIDFAKNAKAAGAKTFVLVSSVGANPKTSNFYLKVKGETEKDLEALEFDSLIILRPSMLMGERKEFRLGELIGKGVMTLFNPLMFGSLSKYKGIQGKTVAKAMLRLSKEHLKGVHVLEGDALHAFSRAIAARSSGVL
ncbi:MAG: NAD(P)H-binding protein [Flavobacteriales bacterium]|nr:NAD(P)H-binding protein [Flavobacteriales bacterium]